MKALTQYVNTVLLLLQWQRTPLHWASAHGHTAVVVSVLLDHSANIEAQDEVRMSFPSNT